MREEEELPDGWTATRLGEVLSEPLRNGHSAKASTDGRGVRAITLTAVTYGDFSERNTKVTCADPDRVRDLWLQPGDILIERSNTPELVGTARLYRGPKDFAIFPDLIIRARFGSRVLPEFAELALSSPRARGYFKGSAQGTAGSMPKIDQGVIETFLLALPDIGEQERVVEAVARTRGSVNGARERLSNVRAILRRLRQGVLAAACDGQLTSRWQASLESQPSSGPAGRSWPIVPAGSVFEVADYGTSVRCERDVPGGIPVLRIPNIASGRLDTSDLKFAPRKSLKAGEADVREGDILVCRTNGSLDLIGKAAVVRGLSRPHSFASYLIRLRVRGNAVLPDFFHLFLSSPAGRDQIERESRTTAGQYNLNLRILNELELPLPPLSEQREIVRRVEALFAVADAIEKRVASATARADKLTQAILAKAFRGELVPTEAELNRRREATNATPPPAARPTTARPAPRRPR